jgi:hypothetical protein
MTMTFAVANMRVARDVREAERALDEALLRQSELFASMVTARREAGLEPFTGHEALLRLTKAQQSLLDAGGDLARVHGQLLDIQREKSGVDECPPEEKTGGHLQDVA